jgi:anaerobic glycerol-3-phosphate dehydrogenase
MQATEPNRRFGQPCVDGFGNKPWDRFYPVELATNFRDLPRTNPSFPGVRDRKVLSRQFEKALSIYNASRQ